MAHREDRYLPIVKLTMEDVLERPLRRVPPQVKATHDFETSDGLSPKIAAEIKELIPSDYLQLRQEVSKQRSVDLSALTMRWNVTIKGETLANRLQPVPDFPDPSPEIIAFWSGVGHVATKAEREIEWRANQTLRPKSQVMLKGLGREIETHLSVLERNGITNTWGRLPVETSELEAVKRALASINQRTHGALCNSPNAHNSGSIRNRRRICARRSATLALTKSMASCGWNQTQNAKSLKKWVPPSAQLEF